MEPQRRMDSSTKTTKKSPADSPHGLREKLKNYGRKIKRAVKILGPNSTKATTHSATTHSNNPAPKVPKITSTLEISNGEVVISPPPEVVHKDFVPRLRPDTTDSPFANLPAELHLEVGSWLSSCNDILNVAKTCRKLGEIYGEKSLYLRMADDLLLADGNEASRRRGWMQNWKMPASYISFTSENDWNKHRLSYFSNFLFRQFYTHSSIFTEWALGDLLELLVKHDIPQEDFQEEVITICRISETLGKRINNYPGRARRIQGHLLRFSNYKLLDCLINNGLRLGSETCDVLQHHKPLHYATLTNNLNSVVYLLHHGFSATELDDAGEPPIFYALGTYPSASGHYFTNFNKSSENSLIPYVEMRIRVIKALIVAGADPQCTILNTEKHHPFVNLFSRYSNAARELEYLALIIPQILPPKFSKLNDTSSKTSQISTTPLFDLASFNPITFDPTSLDAVQIKIDINTVYASNDLFNPLDFLVCPIGTRQCGDNDSKIDLPFRPRLTLLKTLLAAGLNPDTRNRAGLTPLQVAILRLGSTFFGKSLNPVGSNTLSDGTYLRPAHLMPEIEPTSPIDANTRTPRSQDTPSKEARGSEKSFLRKAIRLLLYHGAIIWTRSPVAYGFNVIEIAAALDEKQFVQILVGKETARRWFKSFEHALVGLEGFERFCRGVGKDAVGALVMDRVRGRLKDFREKLYVEDGIVGLTELRLWVEMDPDW